MRHDRFMNTVFQIAQELPKTSDQRVAAIIAYKNNTISVGCNQPKTHPMVAQNNCHEWCEYLHAETSAIINALRQISSRKLAKCVMYVCRAKYNNGSYTWGISKPCIDCRKFLQNYPVHRVYYSTEEIGVYEVLK